MHSVKLGYLVCAATVHAFRKLSSVYVFSYFPFGFEGRIWDLIVSVPDHCLSFYFCFCLSAMVIRSTCARLPVCVRTYVSVRVI